MNEIDLLKKVRDDVRAPDPLTLARARQQLLNPPAARRRFVRPRLIVAAAVAAALAVGFLVTDAVTHDGHPAPGVDAAASQLLLNAAELSSNRADPPIPPGQFRYLRVRTSQLSGDEATGRPIEFRELSQLEWWIPSNQKPPWTTTYSRLLKVDFFSRADEDFARKNIPGLFKAQTGTFKSLCGTPDSVAFVINPDGTVEGGFGAGIPTGGCRGDWRQPTTDFLAKLPKDPAALLQALRVVPAGKDDTDGTAFERIGSVLASGLVPADLRAALYRAAREIAGVRVVDGVVNLDGTSGRAVTREADGYRTDLIIDPSTGRFIGRRTVATKAEGKINRGDVINWTAVTTRITASAPRVR